MLLIIPSSLALSSSYFSIILGAGSRLRQRLSAAFLFSDLRLGCRALLRPPFRPASRRNFLTELFIAKQLGIYVWIVLVLFESFFTSPKWFRLC